MDHLQTAPWREWETVSLIGRGGYGTVYEIRRQLIDGDTETAAMKVISIPRNAADVEEMLSEGYDSETITATFKAHLRAIVAEYSMMRKMDGSANIVNCKDICYIQHDDGIGWDIFIRMERLTPLMKLPPDQLSEDVALKVARDMCKALVLCKKNEIVHRDIKPQNIFVSVNGDYKLGDFGIAKTMEKTMGGTRIGTYKYMAPEIYNNQPYSSSADIYSLGLVLYWLLNDRRMPFMPNYPTKPKFGDEEEAKRRRLLGEDIPPPRNGSAELKAIALKACAYLPHNRYKTAEEMLEALTRLELRQLASEEMKPENDGVAESQSWNESDDLPTECIPWDMQADATERMPDEEDATELLVTALDNVKQSADPEPQQKAEMVILEDGGWRCSCGRSNAAYVSSCTCGVNKRTGLLQQTRPVARSTPKSTPKAWAPQSQWQCKCGRAHASYVSRCSCGVSKRDVKNI